MKTNVITHKLDGVVIQPNTNDGNVRITIRQNTANPNAAPIIKTNTWDFPHSVAEIINKRIEDGGAGVTEGPLYEQEITDSNGTLELYKANLNLMGANVTYSCENIRGVEGVLNGQNEWLSDVSKGVMFQDLDLEEYYIQIPYVISTIPNYTEAAIATITAYVVLSKAQDILKEILKIIAEITSVISAIAALLKILVVIAWAIITLALIIVLLADIFDHLVQPVKYHASMKLRKLLEIGCEQIGLEGFQSTIFDNDETINNLVVLPAKQKSCKDTKNEFSLGFTLPDSTKTKGQYSKSFFDLLEAVKKLFYAEIDIIDNVMHLETIGAPVSDPVYELPDLPNLPTDPHKTNLQEAYNSHYELFFLVDLSDENTIDNYKGTRTSAITRPIIVDDPKAVIGGKYVRVEIPFSRGFGKKELTGIEKQLNTFFLNHYKSVNDLIALANTERIFAEASRQKVSKMIKAFKLVGINIPFDPQPIPEIQPVSPNQIGERIDMLLLAKDFFLNDKLLSLNIGSSDLLTKVREDNAEKVNSEHIYTTYHTAQSLEVTEKHPTGNQYNIYKHDAFQLCKEGVKEIIENKRIFTFSKRSTAEVVSCDWFAETGIGEIEIKIPMLITDNFKTKLITPDGL